MIIGEIIESVNNSLSGSGLTEENINDDLGAYGLDSLTMIKVIVDLEEKYQCQIPDAKVIYSQMNTIEKIFNIMKEVTEGTIGNE